MNRSSGRQLVSGMLIELSKRDDKTSKDAANFIRNTLGVANTIQSLGWIFEIGYDLIEDITYPQVWETDKIK
jgi:hypothetical protein